MMFFKNLFLEKLIIFLKENRFIRSCFFVSFILFFISFFLNYFYFLGNDFNVVVKSLSNYSKYTFSRSEINLYYAFFLFILVLNLFLARRVYKIDAFLSRLIAFATMSLFLLILVFTSVIILNN